MKIVEVGTTVPDAGEIEFVRGGKPIAHVVVHPRQEGLWLASAPGKELRLRKFKTRNGAVKFAERACSAILHEEREAG